MINGLGLFFLFIPDLRCSFGRLELGLDSRISRRYGPIGVDRLGGVELGLSSRYFIGQILECLTIHIVTYIAFQRHYWRRFDIDVDFEQALPW